MEHYTFNKNHIIFALNPPVRETSYLCEDFNFRNKGASITSWIEEMLAIEDTTTLQFFLANVFSYLKTKARLQELDYLQKVELNGEETWIIDDGNSICWMRREEY
jgi:hypothetical protein